MNPQAFERAKHVYANEAFVELVKDAVRFFNGTPVHALPPPQRFLGTGVYALYYTGRTGLYKKYGELNRLAYGYPIYVGKAVPKGWRQGRTSDAPGKQSAELFNRLAEHSRNILAVSGVDLGDFMCRFVILEEASSDMIGTIEAALIKVHSPLWNTSLDGFGNHTPGQGRFNQARSDWDVIHPGRTWAAKCLGAPSDRNRLLEKIDRYLEAKS